MDYFVDNGDRARTGEPAIFRCRDDNNEHYDIALMAVDDTLPSEQLDDVFRRMEILLNLADGIPTDQLFRWGYGRGL